MKLNKCQNNNKEEKDDKGKDKKSHKSTIEQWASLSPEEKRKKYLKSIPAQVSASMAFEGEHVSVSRLKELLKKEKVNKVK